LTIQGRVPLDLPLLGPGNHEINLAAAAPGGDKPNSLIGRAAAAEIAATLRARRRGSDVFVFG
jgi:hypothetical protein